MMGWGEWQLPHGPLAWAALVLAVLAVAVRPSRAVVLACAALAAVGSAAYVPLILRGAPRIIDSTAYWLASRLFASGHLVLATEGPASSYRGRFLLETTPGSFAVIFPPGYPALLSGFQLLHAPWVLGPLLAAALAVLTARLAARLAPAAHRTSAMVVAAGLSLASGAVRYHTADTMAHGLVMVAAAAAILCILHEDRAWLAGVCLGLVVTTRFASAVALTPVLFWLAGHRRAWALVLGAAPLLVALGVYQHAVTGSAFVSPQSLYYLRADAPAGCFRYGFGASTGCDFEHGAFVHAHLPDHVYGAWAAFGVTTRRLRLHALDVANFEPLALLVLVGMARVRPRVVALYPLFVVLAYAPFYFDGNYPGGGARFFSDALPVEHALLAAVVTGAWARAIPAVAFVGFAVHAAPEHAKLGARDGGVPMWSDEALTTSRPLVLVNTDHGFDLAPRDAKTVARVRGDANDALLVGRVGPARLAYFDVAHGFTFSDYDPPRTWRFEGEHEWPARNVQDATAIPRETACGYALALRGQAVTTSLWIAEAGTWRVRVHGRASSPLRVELGGRTVTVDDEEDCGPMDLGSFTLTAGDHDVRWTLAGASLDLDALEAFPEAGEP